MIRVLEILEEKYPENCKVGKLTSRLELNSPDREFSKVIEYLASTSKIQGTTSALDQGIRLTFFSQDEIYITQFGIEFLTDIKKAEADEKRTGAMTDATIVLASVGFIQGLIYFKQFSLGVTDLISWLILCVIGGTILFVIFPRLWKSLFPNLRFKK